jgi:Uncharacterised nucleotidyltransferase
MTIACAPEYALLLDSLSPSAPPRVDHRHWEQADWDRALAVAGWHRLSPILFHHLARHNGVPAEVMDTLEDAYLENAARNLFIDSALEMALEAFERDGIPALLLKGAALVRTVYPDPALRQMLDLDILVPEAKLDAAGAMLAELGYRTESAHGPKTAHVTARANHHHDPALIHEQRITAIELHHHVAMSEERTHFDVAGVWERARQADRAPAHLVPAAEDLLLHVCFHFTRNRLGGSWRRAGTGSALAQIADIAWIVESHAIDWDALGATVRSYKLDARVFLALFAARELGVPIPGRALQALRPSGFDPRLGRRMVALRVLRTNEHLPVRPLRFMLAPRREILTGGWDADPGDAMSLARAYMRRAKARAPQMRSALRQPWSVVQDYRLNGQIHELSPRD